LQISLLKPKNSLNYIGYISKMFILASYYPIKRIKFFCPLVKRADSRYFVEWPIQLRTFTVWTEHFKTYIPPETSGGVYRDSKRNSEKREERESAASQRITFQEEFAAETQEQRRSMVRRSSSTYNGEVSIRSERESKSEEDEGARARKTEARHRGESEREREITKASPLSGNCAMACRRGYLMATMQIPIPTLISAFSRGTIEEEARTRLRPVFGPPSVRYTLTLNRMLFLFFFIQSP